MHVLRPIHLILAAGAAMTLSSCLSRGVSFAPFLTPDVDPTRDELISYVNAWAALDSLVLRVDLQIETVVEEEEGEGRRYRTAEGRLLLERPGHIRLNIEAPILSADIAEMASNGERFQLLIHPAEYRALIEGSNDKSYRSQSARLDDDPELQKAGPLVNIRPQHFTDAFLFDPIDERAAGGERSTLAFVQEELVEEPDTRPRAKKNDRVRKSYYVLTAVRLGDNAPRRRYWFDRVGGLTLTRQQVYDSRGLLIADITYSGRLPQQNGSNARLASKVRIERPYDDYTLAVTVKEDGIILNRDLPDTAFVIDPPEAWGDTLRRINLDDEKEPTP